MCLFFFIPCSFPHTPFAISLFAPPLHLFSSLFSKKKSRLSLRVHGVEYYRFGSLEAAVGSGAGVGDPVSAIVAEHVGRDEHGSLVDPAAPRPPPTGVSFGQPVHSPSPQKRRRMALGTNRRPPGGRRRSQRSLGELSGSADHDGGVSAAEGGRGRKERAAAQAKKRKKGKRSSRRHRTAEEEANRQVRAGVNFG